jgi:hypothetical protein
MAGVTFEIFRRQYKLISTVLKDKLEISVKLLAASYTYIGLSGWGPGVAGPVLLLTQHTQPGSTSATLVFLSLPHEGQKSSEILTRHLLTTFVYCVLVTTSLSYNTYQI